MAIIRDDNEFKNKNVNVGGGASQLGGGYSSGGGSATGPQAGNVPSSSWTNIQEYLGNAGQGAPIAQGMSGEVETQGMDVQKGITGWESDVGNQIKSGTPTMDQGSANTMASGGGIDPYYKTSYQGGKDAAPTQVGKVVAPTVSYAGPTDPTATKGYGDIKKSSQDLTEKSNQLGEWSGIQGYLKGTAKGPYTQGMSNYDTPLAKTSGGDLMGRTKAKYNQTGKQLDTAASNLSTAAKNAGYQADYVNKQWADATDKFNTNADATNKYYADLQSGAVKSDWQKQDGVNQAKAKQDAINTMNEKYRAEAPARAEAAKVDQYNKIAQQISNPLGNTYTGDQMRTFFEKTPEQRQQNTDRVNYANKVGAGWTDAEYKKFIETGVDPTRTKGKQQPIATPSRYGNTDENVQRPKPSFF